VLTVRLGIAAVVVATAAGCGGSDQSKPAPSVSGEQRGVLATVDALQAASRHDDARRICTQLFTKSLAASIRKSSKRSCEAEVHETLTSPDAQLSVARRITVKGSRATATVHEETGKVSTVTFVRDGGRWRIERVTPVKSP